MKAVKLEVDGRTKLSTELSYCDLVILTSQYVERNGRMPTTKEMNSKNNLPQQRIFNKLRHDARVTYSDFCWQFGKCLHVRADIEDYDLYLQKFIRIGNEIGHAIPSNKLCSSEYRLPNAKWLVKNCPDGSVKNYGDFVRWCGLEEPKHIFTKDEVGSVLRRKESELHRPILRNDISAQKTGFSLNVVNRLFGSLSAARKELGLTLIEQIRPVIDKRIVTPEEKVKEIEDKLLKIVNDYKSKTGLSYITWDDIEHGQYAGISVSRKTVQTWFGRTGKSIKVYLKSLGCVLGSCRNQRRELLITGEYVESKLEYKVTTYLNQCGLEYNKDYFRSVKYSDFVEEESNINCDYVINYGTDTYYIEVCGMISKKGGKWRDTIFSTDIENTYKLKTVYKESVLLNNNLIHLFLFPEDFWDNTYQNKLNEMLFHTSCTARCA